ncbi:MAG TPA: polyprenyl synthetase family protein [bacterium]|nr:polyprenyl synthetase family protein [bacterium]
MKYETQFKTFLEAIEKTLHKVLPPENRYPQPLHEAMHYAVFSGGKRFRPVLALAACEACGGDWREALFPAAALECIHSYSLVHDDLPALDNDDMRRGKPTCHKQFGEAMAILAGDSLLTYAFEILSRVKPVQKAARLISELSTASGTYGMIGGQAADLIAGPSGLDLPMLDYISVHKTGKLIKASAVMGALAASATPENLERMLKYGESIGLAFQSIDDLLDGDGYLRIVKPREMRQKIRDLVAKAKREIRPLGKKAEKLQALADFLLERMPRRERRVAVDR